MPVSPSPQHPLPVSQTRSAVLVSCGSASTGASAPPLLRTQAPRLTPRPPRAPRGLTTSQPPFDTWGLCGAGGRGPALSPNTSRAGAPGQARVRAQPAAHAAPPPQPPRSGQDTSLSYLGEVGGGERKLGMERAPPAPLNGQPQPAVRTRFLPHSDPHSA